MGVWLWGLDGEVKFSKRWGFRLVNLSKTGHVPRSYQHLNVGRYPAIAITDDSVRHRARAEQEEDGVLLAPSYISKRVPSYLNTTTPGCQAGQHVAHREPEETRSSLNVTPQTPLIANKTSRIDSTPRLVKTCIARRTEFFLQRLDTLNPSSFQMAIARGDGGHRAQPWLGVVGSHLASRHRFRRMAISLGCLSH